MEDVLAGGSLGYSHIYIYTYLYLVDHNSSSTYFKFILHNGAVNTSIKLVMITVITFGFKYHPYNRHMESYEHL